MPRRKLVLRERTGADDDPYGYWTEWYCPPPPPGVRFRVTEQVRVQVLRRIYSWERDPFGERR
jgi:hypothetical protein